MLVIDRWFDMEVKSAVINIFAKLPSFLFFI